MCETCSAANLRASHSDGSWVIVCAFVLPKRLFVRLFCISCRPGLEPAPSRGHESDYWAFFQSSWLQNGDVLCFL
jgi:hypothetical protein